MRTQLSAALVVLVVAVVLPASGQLVVSNDQTSPTMWLINLGGGPNTALVTGAQATSWGLTCADNTNTIWWNNGGSLLRAAYGAAPLTPVVVGNMTIGGTNMNVTGMAYDTTNNTLYGYRSVTAPGFYSIKQDDATCTLAALTPANTDFGGFDYDPVTNAFYGLNDGTGLQGRGLYRITGIAGGAPTYTLLTAYPSGETDIDGLAIGNGRAYMVNDTSAQGIYVFNLSTNSYEPNLASAFTGTNGIFAGGGWAPGLIPEPTSLALVGIFGLALRRSPRKLPA